MNNASKLIKQNFELKKENIKLKEENAALKKEIKRLNVALSGANLRIKQLEEKYKKYVESEEQRIQKIVNKAVKQVTDELNKQHKKEVDELEAKISRLEKRLNLNSSNSGIPTSKDRIGFHKIQNNREKSSKNIGAQEGHEIHKLEYFKDDEITEVVEHTLDKCPKCGGSLIEVNVVKSDVIDIKISVSKTRNNIHNYKCSCCKTKVSANNTLIRGVTYGDNIKAMTLSMMNESNTPLNKISSFISGITNNEIKLSEGYLLKIQKQSAENLKEFIQNLKEKVISLKHVFWDDTTVNFGLGKPSEGYDSQDLDYLNKIKNDEKNKEKKIREGIIRFYGDKNWAFLVGHRTKKKEGIDSDGILENLDENCVVMHDHVLLNYNNKYSFKNAECNEHVKRYLKKNLDMFPEHSWAKEMRDFIINLYEEKMVAISNKETNFSEEKIHHIYERYQQIIEKGYKENNTVDIKYILNKNDELNLIERLDKFRENHLMFATDFSVEFTNNTSEKGLRQVKRKIAVSFSFKNANRMKDYATILSYLETCYRNGISRYDASKRLICGCPYTIDEINLKLNDKNKDEKN